MCSACAQAYYVIFFVNEMIKQVTCLNYFFLNGGHHQLPQKWQNKKKFTERWGEFFFERMMMKGLSKNNTARKMWWWFNEKWRWCMIINKKREREEQKRFFSERWDVIYELWETSVYLLYLLWFWSSPL